MIDYIEAKKKLSEYALTCSILDYNFAILIVNGLTPERAYLFSHKIGQSIKEGEAELDTSEEIYKKEARKLFAEAYIKRLIDIIQKSYETDLVLLARKRQDLFELAWPQLALSNGGEDMDSISVKDLERIIKKYIIAIDKDPTLFKTSETVQLLKVAIEKFVKDDSDDNLDKHIVVTYLRFNGICKKCNKEIDIVRGAKTVCPHCGNICEDTDI